MALTDNLSGLISATLNINVLRSNPTGLDTYKESYSKSWDNTDSVGDETAGRLFAVFHETVTVTISDVTISLASSTDPMGTIGTNVPSGDTTDGTRLNDSRLKVFAVRNLSPDDGTGTAIFLEANSSGISGITGGPIGGYSGEGASPNDAAIYLPPQGVMIWTNPRGSTPMTASGTLDQMRVKCVSGTAEMEVLYAVG